MEIMNNQFTTIIEATQQNIDIAIENIKKFAIIHNYQIIGKLQKNENFLHSIFNKRLKFDSKSIEKVCRNYLTRLNKKIGMSLSNRFLHFLYKKVYKMDTAPRIEYSVQELSIIQARKAWKKSLTETNKLLLDYKNTKKDFYFIKNVVIDYIKNK